MKYIRLLYFSSIYIGFPASKLQTRQLMTSQIRSHAATSQECVPPVARAGCGELTDNSL